DSATSASLQPRTNYTYNALGECTLQSELVDASEKRAVLYRSYDHNGNVDLCVSPNGYVTQSAFGMRQVDPSKGCIELERTNWYNALPDDWYQSGNLNKESIISLIKPNPKFDIHYHWRYDRR